MAFDPIRGRPIRITGRSRKPDPGKIATWLLAGDRLLRAGRLVHAERRYRQVADARPFSARPYFRMAMLDMIDGRFRSAVEHLRQAERAEPGWHADHREDLVQLVGGHEAYRALSESLDRHLIRRPTDSDAWIIRAAVSTLLGDGERASDEWLRVPDYAIDESLAAYRRSADLFAEAERSVANSDQP